MFMEDRRRFLKFLAGSPLLTALPAAAWQEAAVLANPKDAPNVMEFEPAARKAQYGCLATGVDDDYTLTANHDAYRRIQLRPRRLVDVREAIMRTNLFGTDWESPVFLCPCGYHKAFHPEGEVATARAARTRKSLMLLSTVTTTPVEEVNGA
jgi:4-hydroxymandelate oxidase